MPFFNVFARARNFISAKDELFRNSRCACLTLAQAFGPGHHQTRSAAASLNAVRAKIAATHAPAARSYSQT